MIYKVHCQNGVVKYTREGILLAKEWMSSKTGKRVSWGLPYVRTCVLEGEKMIEQGALELKEEEKK